MSTNLGNYCDYCGARPVTAAWEASKVSHEELIPHNQGFGTIAMCASCHQAQLDFRREVDRRGPRDQSFGHQV